MAKVNSVSVAADGALWCITADGRLHERAGNGWRADAGPAHPIVEVSVSSRLQVFCRDNQGNVFVKTDPSLFHGVAGWMYDNRVHSIAGSGVRAIAAQGSAIWFVTREGVPNCAALGDSAPPFADDAIDIAAGRFIVYISKAGSLKLLKDNGSQKSWQKIQHPKLPGNAKQIKIQSVDIGVEGVMWATDFNDNIYHCGPGGSWLRNPHGMAKQISVGSVEHVYCVNDAGQLYRAENGGAADTGWQRIAEPGLRAVTVQPGQSVSGIIKAFCPSLTFDQWMAKVDEAVALNQLADPNVIQPGQTLLIPDC